MGLRTLSASHYIETLHERFRPEFTEGIDAVVQFELTGEGGGVHHAIVKGADLKVIAGAHPAPAVTLTAAAADWVKLVNGEMHGPLAFAMGRIKIRGDHALAQRMQEFFPPARRDGRNFSPINGRRPRGE